MTDRLQEIRARLDAAITARNAGCWDEPAERELALNSDADIAWLLDEVERLRKYAVHGHNDCWQSGKCVCGLDESA